jgi:uncharacterized membrane protein YqaE (UPF0057 family)
MATRQNDAVGAHAPLTGEKVPATMLPPLAIYLKTNSAKDTIINIVLCCLFWIPAILHALYLILK